MISATPQDVCAAGWHEGGHAVVGRRVFGLPIERATIADDAGGLVRFEQGPYQRTSPREKILISLAGPAAEHLSNGGADLAPLPEPGSGDDRNLTAAQFDQLSAAEQLRLRYRARQLVRTHRNEVETIGTVLPQRGTLSGADIDALLMNAKEGVRPMRQDHQIDDDDNFETLPDGKKILKDGRSTRVRLQMRDSLSPLQRAVMHDSEQRRARLHDGHDNTDLVGHRPGYIMSDAVDERERERAYRNYTIDAINAWRPTALEDWGATAGAVCMTDNKEPGHMRRIGSRLVCVPDNQRDALHVGIDHQQRMRAEYAAYDSWVSQQWRSL